MAAILGVEKDVEKAVHAALIAARTSGTNAAALALVTAANYVTFLNANKSATESPTEPSYPYVVIECLPVTFKGKNASQYDGTLEVAVHTSMGANKDASRQDLATIAAAVANVLDTAAFGVYTSSIKSLELIREGGSNEKYENSSAILFTCRLMACGNK